MTTDLVVRDPQQMALSNDQLAYIASTEFVPPGLRGNLPAILACVATGRALGIADMTALRSIHIIDGKATFSAELMVQLVRRQGHSITGEVTPGAATVTGTRVDNGDTMTVTWTLEMAERAGIASKQNWKKYPEAMLWARAASQLCRMLFADCFAGATYTPEEIGAETDADGEPVAEGDPAAGTPFADDPEEEYVPVPATAKQKKLLNVLVGQLRETGAVTTEQVWLMAGHTPEPGEDGELHWSPLRDRLERSEATGLIEQLKMVEAAGSSLSEGGSVATSRPGAPALAGTEALDGAEEGSTRPPSESDRLVAQILATYPPDRHSEVTAYIQGHARGGDPVWLREQLAKREGAVA